MAFTEFCCRSGGSNLNAGTRQGTSTEPGVSADLTYASGSWVSSTRVFTVASGNPITDGVTVGDFASVYPDGSTLAVYIGRVTARTATTITVPAGNSSGTAPADGTNTRTLKIGGAWKGPNGADAFPFAFVTSSLSNGNSDPICINFKNDADYNITAAMSHNLQALRYDGYATAYHDGGKAAIDGGAAGAAYVLLTVSATGGMLRGFIFKNNGDTGNANGLVLSGGGGRFNVENCVAHHLRGIGFLASGSSDIFVECEAYACNGSNTAGQAGFLATGSAKFVRCISHDNVGSNSSGFIVQSQGALISCIADSNGSHGFSSSGNVSIFLSGCDAYNNAGSGIVVANNAGSHVENCSMVKNGAFGFVGATAAQGLIINCGFGSGTQANSSGQMSSVASYFVSGSVTYAADATPWIDPANGDFRINLVAAQGAGRGQFTETQAGYAGTVGYPDIGAGVGQATFRPLGSLVVHPGMSGGVRG